MKAIVRWFDNLKGEGVIKVGEKSIFVHYSAIDKHIKLDKNFYWRILFPGQVVNVEIYTELHFTQIDRVY